MRYMMLICQIFNKSTPLPTNTAQKHPYTPTYNRRPWTNQETHTTHAPNIRAVFRKAANGSQIIPKAAVTTNMVVFIQTTGLVIKNHHDRPIPTRQARRDPTGR